MNESLTGSQWTPCGFIGWIERSHSVIHSFKEKVLAMSHIQMMNEIKQ